MSADDPNDVVASELKKLLPIITNTLVNQAVIRALIATHPNPTGVRQIAESILMQAQGHLALAADPSVPRLPMADVDRILDSMFKPPVHLTD